MKRRVQRRLQTLRAEAGESGLEALRQHHDLFGRLRRWVIEALAHSHLTTTAAELVRAFGADEDALDRLGVPVDLLECFPRWRAGSRVGFRTAPSGLQLAPAGAGEPLHTLRLQLSPLSSSVALALHLLRDLLRRLDPDVSLVVVAEPGADLKGLRALAAELAGKKAERVRFVHLATATVFAQDNARAARDSEGNPVLLLPRAFRSSDHRARDAMELEEVEGQLGVTARRSRLYWEGGNVVSDRRHCLVGVDSVAESMGRLGLTARETVALLAAEVGAAVTPLGDLSQTTFDPEHGIVASGQASFHVDLDVSLLGRFGRRRRPVAICADAARGIDLLPAVLHHRPLFSSQFVSAPRARALIAAEYEACAQERLPRLLEYADTLEKLGYRVVGVPDLRVDPRENVFDSVNLNLIYCNVLPGRHAGRPAVYYLPYGIDDLDKHAEKRFARAGVTPVRISSRPLLANRLMSLLGGLHCACGPLI